MLGTKILILFLPLLLIAEANLGIGPFHRSQPDQQTKRYFEVQQDGKHKDSGHYPNTLHPASPMEPPSLSMNAHSNTHVKVHSSKPLNIPKPINVSPSGSRHQAPDTPVPSDSPKPSITPHYIPSSPLTAPTISMNSLDDELKTSQSIRRPVHIRPDNFRSPTPPPITTIPTEKSNDQIVPANVVRELDEDSTYTSIDVESPSLSLIPQSIPRPSRPQITTNSSVEVLRTAQPNPRRPMDLNRRNVDMGPYHRSARSSNPSIQEFSEDSFEETAYHHREAYPRSQLHRFMCPERYGYYKIPDRCGEYVECKNYTPLMFTCPVGLYFNPFVQWTEYPCDHPSKVECEPVDKITTTTTPPPPPPTTRRPPPPPTTRRPPPPTTRRPPPPPPTTRRPPPPPPTTRRPPPPPSTTRRPPPPPPTTRRPLPTTTRRPPPPPTTARPIVTTPEPNVICPEPHGYFRFTNECGEYVECKNYVPLMFICPSGLHFNPLAEWTDYPCQHPSKVQCNREPVVYKPKFSIAPLPTEVTSRPSISKVTSAMALQTERPSIYTVQSMVTPRTTAVTHRTTAVTPRTTAVTHRTTAVTPRTTAVTHRTTAVTPRTKAVTHRTTAVTHRTTDVTRRTHRPSTTVDPRSLIDPTMGVPSSKQLFDYSCPDSNGFYAVALQCDVYVECKSDIAIEHSCPDGLHFNPNTQWPDYPCSYPSEVNCDSGAKIQEPNPTKTCPHRDGFFPANDTDEDCGSYIVCHAGVATLEHCSPGLVFNFEKDVCDWPINVPSCDRPRALQGYICPATHDAEADVIHKYRYERSCREFIACQEGQPRLLKCDANLYFDENTESCVNSELVEDCDADVVLS